MSTRKTKAPRFLAARVSLYAVGAASAVFGLAGWLPLTWETAAPALMTALSALIVPLCIEIVGKSKASALVIMPVAVFAAINAYSFHHAVEVRVEAPRIAAHEAKFAPVTVAYAAARQAVLDHKLPAFPADMIAPRVRDNTKAWQVAHDALIATKDALKAEVDAIPAYAPMVPDLFVIIIAACINLSLALGLGGIALVRASIERKLQAERAKARKAKPVRKAKARDLVTPMEQDALLALRGPRLTVVR